jgi:hypothetical protein
MALREIGYRYRFRGFPYTPPALPDRDEHEDLIQVLQVMQDQTLPAMKKYAATPLSKPRVGAARPQLGAAGAHKGDLYTLSGLQAPEQGKHVPEVGLELHSLPRKPWTP